MSDETERRRRAAERRPTVRWVPHGREDEAPPTCHGAEAISLVTQLTREAWALSGRPWPDYPREATPIRFVPLSVHFAEDDSEDAE